MVLGILLLILLVIIVVDILLIGLPIIKFAAKLGKDKFLIIKPNHSEKQGKILKMFKRSIITV